MSEVSAAEPSAPGGLIVDIRWLRDQLGQPGVRIVDARQFEQYAAGHIPGAINSENSELQIVDSSSAGVAEFLRRVERELRRIGVRRGERVIFYEEFSGPAAARGVWLLDYVCHGGRAMLDGGLQAWIAAGGAVNRLMPEVESSNLKLAPDSDLMATAEELRAALDSDAPSLQIVDTRNDLEFAVGTIPGAILLEWSHHLQPDGSFRPLDQPRAMYAGAGVSQDSARAVATFCASGFLAAHRYVALRALGYPRVKNDAASWGEWGQRPGLPVQAPRRNHEDRAM